MFLSQDGRSCCFSFKNVFLSTFAFGQSQLGKAPADPRDREKYRQWMNGWIHIHVCFLESCPCVCVKQHCSLCQQRHHQVIGPSAVFGHHQWPPACGSANKEVTNCWWNNVVALFAALVGLDLVWSNLAIKKHVGPAAFLLLLCVSTVGKLRSSLWKGSSSTSWLGRIEELHGLHMAPGP